MPTYDYKCNACSHTFEQFQSMKDKPLKKCPKCGKPALERLIGTGAAVIFKGSGFYQTDYRSDSYKKAAEAESKASSSASSGDGKGAETKPTETKSAESKPAETKSSADAAKPATPTVKVSDTSATAKSSTGSTGKKKSNDRKR